ncbi:MAG TPA: hypothetical protein VE172_17375 [Stackebrandtia sp.]|jgi:autotransporter adhesin|uniref:hypothetical protein n=1 Tax=Stackebrandtia sp. TaxID=2023065 RepID=UPI002D499B01|nr:hypothetical protein [Stackebrandtia sp.]HZE40576.1 hypothetical protein [Stackebrandtia sp.]
MPDPLVADLMQLHNAGKNLLPEAAKTYGKLAADGSTAQTELGAVSSESGHVAFWSSANSTLKRLFDASSQHMTDAGNLLLLIAYSYAEHDQAAATALKKDDHLDHLPSLKNGKWV